MWLGEVEVATTFFTFARSLPFWFRTQFGITVRAMFDPDSFFGPAEGDENEQEYDNPQRDTDLEIDLAQVRHLPNLQGSDHFVKGRSIQIRVC